MCASDHGRNLLVERTLLRIAAGFATVPTAKRIVQALDTSMAYLVGCLEEIRNDQ
jgi:hypothetical protein